MPRPVRRTRRPSRSSSTARARQQRTTRPTRPAPPSRPARSVRRTRRGTPTTRLRWGFLIIAMVLTAFMGRLVQLQGIDPGAYAVMASKEGTRDVVLPARRGDIFDREGKPLASSVEGLMVLADPAVTVSNAPELAKFLAKRLDVDYFPLLAKLRDRSSRFEYVARQVPSTKAADVVAKAEELGLEGLWTESDPLREYPGGDIGANLVGFVPTGETGGAEKSGAGLERVFDKSLSGTDGEARYETDSSGNRIPLGTSSTTEARDGEDLHTTIDRDLQWYTQRVLRQAVEDAGGESGLAVIMDTQTGEVLSLADDPTFDANQYGSAPAEDLGSRALSQAYEPGSVEKVLTVASLVDSGEVTARTRLKVPGSLQRQDRVIRDYWEHGVIRLTLAGVIAKSSNIGTILAADRFAPGELRSYLRAFGLGDRTHVGLAGESAGILPQGAAWTDQAEDRISFGQSLSVNGLQMTAAVNAVANGGVRVDPSLVEGSAVEPDGTVVGTDVASTRRVVSEEAARQTSQMMERVLDPEEGVAPGAAVPGYRVAGKTGTAQRVVDGVYDGSTTVSFAGFAPADAPRFTIYVAIQAPSNGGGGGSVAGPVFSRLMSYTLQRYGVPPTGTAPSTLPVTW